MPVILAFGDSNTWGSIPGEGARYTPDVRWTGVMARELGAGYQVIEEGLRGRTTVFDDPDEPGRNGLVYFAPCLLSHAPLDLVIVALGCNDCKAKFGATPEAIAAGAERLIDATEASLAGPGDTAPRVLLVAPPPISRLTEYAEMFAGGADKALRLPACYRELARRRSIGFLNAGDFIVASPLDGIHYAADQHAILGHAIAKAARAVLE